MRTQFYDPFGMRMQGFRAGVQDEMQVQDQTRRADQFDWERANIRPLQLQAAQRNEAYNQYADPFLRNSTRRLDYQGDAAAASDFGFRSGNWAPAMMEDFNYFVPMSEYYRPDSSFYDQFDPTTGLTEMGFRMPDGSRSPLQMAPQNYSDYYRLTNPAVSAYDQFNSRMQFDGRQNAAQRDASMGWLQWQQEQQARQSGNPGDAFGLGRFNFGF